MPINLVEMSTSDPEVAHAALNRVYNPNRPASFSGPTAGFVCDMRFADAGDVGVDRIRHTASAAALVPPPDMFLTAAVLTGELHIRAGQDEAHLGSGAVVRHTTRAAANVAWSNLTVTTLRLPLDAVRRVAFERLGIAPVQLRFQGLNAISPSAARQWRLLTEYTHRATIGSDSPLETVLVQAQLRDLLAATALTTFPNTSMSIGYVAEPGYVAAASLRRAVAYIDDNAARAITATDIAEAAGVSARALQLVFRRHLSTTPMGYLRRVRLSAAHRELLAADPDGPVTVAAVAARWGFGPSARFAEFYRQQYGVLPSHSLRGDAPAR